MYVSTDTNVDRGIDFTECTDSSITGRSHVCTTAGKIQT